MNCTFTLPWFPKELSPNVKKHWAEKNRARKSYAKTVGLELIAQKVPRSFTACQPKIHITFHPPDNRRRDIDNMVAAMKAGIDQIAKHISVDDSEFEYGEPRKAEAVPGGRIEITIEARDW